MIFKKKSHIITKKKEGIIVELKPLNIGSVLLKNNVLMAPLAGYTCYPFRMLAREMGAALCYTEMVSSNGLKYKDKASLKLLFTTEKETPKAAQILGSDSRVMAEMCRTGVPEEYDIIDINMGCPVPNVIKSKEGCALMGDLKRASKIIRACADGKRPVTVKFRTGLSESNMITAEFAKMCEDSGASMITIHGRSRNMMYTGVPYYEQIQQAKAAVSIPVIANGGIYSVEDAEKMLKETGADGVMIARYALENPYIFSELTHTPIKKSRLVILQEQLSLCRSCLDEDDTLAYMKKITSYFMKKRHGTKKYKAALYQCGNCEELLSLLETIFHEKGVPFE